MKKFLPIILLIIISAFLIFYRFTDIPKYLAYDEVEFTKLALSLNNKPYIPYSQLATGHSTLYFYIILSSLKTFGINTFALRFPAAIFGILSVLMFYLLARLSFRASARNLNKHNHASLDFSVASLLRNDLLFPFLLSFIFLSSRWFLNFARFSFEVTFLLFLELTSLYFLLKFNENLKAKIPNFLRFDVFRQKISVSSFYITFSGLFAGLAFLSYTPGRIFFLLPIGYLFLTMKSASVKTTADKQSNNETIKRVLLFLIPFIIIITPLTSYLLTNKDTRIDQQFFLKNNEMTINEKVDGLWSNISSTSLMFFIKGDMNGRHNYPGKPALNPILGILFIIGLAISIKNWKNPYNFFSIFYFVLSILPALMTYPWENPNMLRTFTVIPAVVYFIGQGFMSFPRRRESILIITVLILLSSFYELRTYFKYQSIVFNQSFEIKLPLERAIKVKPKP